MLRLTYRLQHVIPAFTYVQQVELLRQCSHLIVVGAPGPYSKAFIMRDARCCMLIRVRPRSFASFEKWQ